MRGVFNILATPFDEHGEIDEVSLRNLVEFQIAAGVSGLTILAILGEGQKLADAEWDLVASSILEQVGNRVEVVVTVTHPSTRVVIRRAERAAELGASAIMAAPPTLLRNLDAVSAFYESLAEASPIPSWSRTSRPARG